MKKFFTLIAVAAMALTASAQTTTYYSIQAGDENVGPSKTISAVDGIKVTFDTTQDWQVGGGDSDAQTVDGMEITGKYATSKTINGANVTFATTKAATLTIIFGGEIATSKKIYMHEGSNKISGKLLSDKSKTQESDVASIGIPQWDGLVYELEANKTYTFYASGTKWRLAAYRFVDSSTAVEAVAEAKAEKAAPVKVIGKNGIQIGNYNIAGQQVK